MCSCLDDINIVNEALATFEIKSLKVETKSSKTTSKKEAPNWITVEKDPDLVHWLELKKSETIADLKRNVYIHTGFEVEFQCLYNCENNRIIPLNNIVRLEDIFQETCNLLFLYIAP